jgi:hypothetical protein
MKITATRNSRTQGLLLRFLTFLVCPLMRNEESDFFYVEQGGVLVNFGEGATATEANCAGLAVDEVLGLNRNGLEAEMTLAKACGELLLVFTINTNCTTQMNLLADRCAEIHGLSFPTEQLTICAIDLDGQEVHQLYTSGQRY